VKVLVAEDDKHIREGLIELLQNEGYETIAVADGQQAIRDFDAESPDFICLDIMMPGVNGYDVCREIRKRNQEMPIIFITAKSEEIDKVIGLELGADDFITKPFGVREVLARIRAVTRRCMASKKGDRQRQSFVMDDLNVLPAELRAQRNEDTIELSLRDIKILETLYKNKGEVVSRDTLFDKCWGFEHMPNSRTLDQHISQLRKRIELDPKEPQIILTVHGAGYRYEAD